MEKPKLLMLLTRFPYPITDGTRYKLLHNVAEGLMKDFTIEFAIITPEKLSPEANAYLEKHFGKVHYFHISWPSFIFRMIEGLFKKRPLQVSGFYSRFVQKWISLHAQEYRLFYIHTIRLAEYIRRLPEKLQRRGVLDFNDALSINYERASRRAAFPLNIFYSIETSRVRMYEKRVLEFMKCATVITERDRAHILHRVSEPLRQKIHFVTIPHGVDDALLERGRSMKGTGAVFIGSLGYLSNIDAVEFFLESIWPAVHMRAPSAVFTIIGKHTLGYPNIVGLFQKLFVKLGGKRSLSIDLALPGVYTTGFVADPYDVLAHSAVSVVPIRLGAGMPSKILESMALGLPVITTVLGAEGIHGLVHKKNIFIIPESEVTQWQQTILDIFNDAGLRNKIGDEAQALIRTSYTKSIVQEEFRSLMREAVRVSE